METTCRMAHGMADAFSLSFILPFGMDSDFFRSIHQSRINQVDSESVAPTSDRGPQSICEGSCAMDDIDSVARDTSRLID